MMKKHCVDKLDIFETSLTVAKALTLLLESEDKDAILDVPMETTLEFFNTFIDTAKEWYGKQKEYLEAISEYVSYLSIMVPHSPTL